MEKFAAPIILSILLVFTATLLSQSKLITTQIETPSLENNILDYQETQPIAVYLPPSYESSTHKYPVVYFLPGYFDVIDYWLTGRYQGYRLKNSMDQLIEDGLVEEMIVVVVSGYNMLYGSFFVNSSVTGNWEDYVAQDVVQYIDGNYRTLPSPESRGICGHSMGGFGAIHVGMKNPDIFGLIYSLSPGLYDENGLNDQGQIKGESKINRFLAKQVEWKDLSREESIEALRAYIQTLLNRGDYYGVYEYSYGAAFSPDPTTNAPFINYPYSEVDGELVLNEDYYENYENGYGGLAKKVEQYAENLRSLKMFTMDVGIHDEYSFIPNGCRYFADLLFNYDIGYKLVEFNGRHENKVAQRIEDFMFPAFSKRMVYDPNITAISDDEAQKKSSFGLNNYPNPFNPSTNIQYSIPTNVKGEMLNVQLKIYDILGTEIKILVDKQQPAGNYEVTFNAENLASGVYIYKLEAGGKMVSRKMILLR